MIRGAMRVATVAAAALVLAPASAQQSAPDQLPATEAATEAVQLGDDFYCRERKLGTWFYCEKPKAKHRVPVAPPPPAPTASAATRLKAIGAELEELKAKAILEPTAANVSAYIAFQRAQLDRASSFADVWRRAVWQNPELDYTLQRPVNLLGKRTWLDQRRQDRDRVMGALARRYGVFYFYSSSCAACEVFSPIMRGVSDRFGLKVMAVSMDGGGSSAFPRFLIDTGQYEAMGLTGKQVPALVLYDTQTKRPMPIGYGVMAADEVMERIFTLTNVKSGSDF